MVERYHEDISALIYMLHISIYEYIVFIYDVYPTIVIQTYCPECSYNL